MSKWSGIRTDAELLEYWKAKTPPTRPSRHAVELYEASLVRMGMHQRGDWAIMGCTPEFRSLAAKYGRPLTCIDREEQPYRALTPLCTPPENERFVKCDWLETELPETFDLILGDGIFGMLPPERYPEIFKSLQRMLKPGGLAIMRILVLDNPQFPSPAEAIRWYRENYRGNLPLTSLRTHFLVHWIDPDSKRIEPSDYEKHIEELYRENILTTEEYETFINYPLNIPIHIARQQELLSLLTDDFDIITIEKPADLLSSNYYPIMTIKKK